MGLAWLKRRYLACGSSSNNVPGICSDKSSSSVIGFEEGLVEWSKPLQQIIGSAFGNRQD